MKQLRNLGIKPEDVGHLILTHLHVDHTGEVTRFPNAKIVVQRKELQTAAAPVHPEGIPFMDGSAAYYREDVATIIWPLWHRLIILDGDREIVPGIRCVLLGGHTPGSQAVYVQTEEGTVILTGDICNTYANFENGPCGLATGC